MLITTGKHIVIEVGDFTFRRTAETPGLVTVTSRRHGCFDDKLSLPGNCPEGQAFVAAYLRILKEDVAYKETEFENNNLPAES